MSATTNLNLLVNTGKTDSLKKLFETYEKINDEEEIIFLSGKLILKAQDCGKEFLIKVFDKIYGKSN